MRSVFAIIFLLNFSIIAQSGTVIKFTPTDDAYVSSAYPDTNFGDANSLISQYSPTNQRQIYLKYNISSIPAGKRIVSAHLKLNAEIVDPNNSSFITWALSGYGGSGWTEQSITWQNRPYPESPYAYEAVLFHGIVLWTVTDGVEYHYMNGTDFCSFAICPNTWTGLTEKFAQFTSKESTDPNLYPVLDIEYENAFTGGDGALK